MRTKASGKQASIGAVRAVGIDMAKSPFQVALYGPDAAGNDRYRNSHFQNTPSGINAFLDYLEQQQAQTAPLCMEATGRYWEPLAFALTQAGHTVSVVNPARIWAYIKMRGGRTKTDKADAQYIARFCAEQHPTPWLPPTPARRELQALTRYREDLKQDRTRTKNRSESGSPSPMVQTLREQNLKQIEEQIAQVEAEIERLSSQSTEFAESMKLLRTIPGIGIITAVHLLAEMPAVANFASVRQLTAYAGLNPSIRQSGKTTHKGKLSKQGNRHLRAALYFGAVAALRCNPLVRPLTTRMKQQGKTGKQCVVASMRKLLHIAYGVLKSGRPFDPAFATAPGLT
jgi:transposase